MYYSVFVAIHFLLRLFFLLSVEKEEEEEEEEEGEEEEEEEEKIIYRHKLSSHFPIYILNTLFQHSDLYSLTPHQSRSSPIPCGNFFHL